MQSNSELTRLVPGLINLRLDFSVHAFMFLNRLDSLLIRLRNSLKVNVLAQNELIISRLHDVFASPLRQLNVTSGFSDLLKISATETAAFSIFESLKQRLDTAKFVRSWFLDAVVSIYQFADFF